MPELPRLELTGTPRERGLTHGERFAGAVEENVEIYLDRFAHEGAEEATVRTQAERFVDLVADANADYAAEMRGVAEGSGVPLADVAMLNARYEVLYGAWAEEARSPSESDAASTGSEPGSAGTDGCTSFGLQPEVTADGRTYVGQNWDWIAAVEPNTFVMDVRREAGPNHVAFTEAGIVGGKFGVNEHGIGLCVNGLVSAADGADPFRKPFHVRCREALDATRFDAAIEPILATDRACSANFLFGHAAGEVIDVEAAPESASHVYPEAGVLTHANHFEAAVGVESTFERLAPNTLCRAPRLRRLLRRAAPDVSVADAKAALRDHFNHPASICRHVDESEPPAEHTRSNASAIIDLEGRRMLATRGPPCESEYRAYEVAT